jgi:hypothetical protein
VATVEALMLIPKKSIYYLALFEDITGNRKNHTLRKKKHPGAAA